jgi:hypothetical protein
MRILTHLCASAEAPTYQFCCCRNTRDQTDLEWIREQRANIQLSSRVLCLHRGTGHRTVRAEDTAVALLGRQPLPTAGAKIEELARVGRHRYGLGGTTARTLNDRLQNHSAPPPRSLERLLVASQPPRGTAPEPGHRKRPAKLILSHNYHNHVTDRDAYGGRPPAHSAR